MCILTLRNGINENSWSKQPLMVEDNPIGKYECQNHPIDEYNNTNII